jgi:outer membrane protein OmpA-like peptidoglycan-associated protein
MEIRKRGWWVTLLALSMAACSQVPNLGDEPASRVERPRPERAVSRVPPSKPEMARVAPQEAAPTLRLDLGAPQKRVPERQLYILFAEGSSALDTQSRTQLQQHAQKLKGNLALMVTLVGYVPEMAGSKAYIQAVVEQRLDAVVAELRSQGVPKRQIRRQSAVDDKTLMRGCASAACRGLAERVELVFSEG